ncbi:outer membrane protein assembly factor BamE domain-containing protein [Nitrosomonas sp. wSCUT-2]
MQLKQWFRNHYRRVFPAVFAAIIGLLFIAFNFSSIEQSFVQQPFDAAKWRQNVESGGNDPTRLQMIDDLLRRYSLQGMTRHEIETLLGKPPETDYFRDYEYVYWLGPERNFISIDSERLGLQFDASGRVSTVSVLRD